MKYVFSHPCLEVLKKQRRATVMELGVFGVLDLPLKIITFSIFEIFQVYVQ